MTPINTMDGAVDFLRAHDCRRDAIAGLWITRDGDPLGSEPVESAELLRRELFRRDMEVNRIRTAITGIIGG